MGYLGSHTTQQPSSLPQLGHNEDIQHWKGGNIVKTIVKGFYGCHWDTLQKQIQFDTARKEEQEKNWKHFET